MPYTATFNDRSNQELEELQQKLGAKSKPEAIAMAVRLAKVYADEVIDAHGKMLVERRDGKTVELKFV